MSKDTRKGCAGRIFVAVISGLVPITVAILNNWEKVFPNTPTPSIAKEVKKLTSPFTGKLGRSVPITWKGEAKETNNRVFDVVLSVEKNSEETFEGNMWWPKINNSINSVEGKIISDFGDFVARTKWRFVDGFDSKQDSKWLIFSEVKPIQGSRTLLGAIYYGRLDDDGSMTGVWFTSKDAAEPSGTFKLSIK